METPFRPITWPWLRINVPIIDPRRLLQSVAVQYVGDFPASRGVPKQGDSIYFQLCQQQAKRSSRRICICFQDVVFVIREKRHATFTREARNGCRCDLFVPPASNVMHSGPGLQSPSPSKDSFGRRSDWLQGGEVTWHVKDLYCCGVSQVDVPMLDKKERILRVNVSDMARSRSSAACHEC